MTKEKWYYLKRQAEKHNTQFLRCDGVLYEAKRRYYPTGESPRWSIEEIRPVDIPAFTPERDYE